MSPTNNISQGATTRLKRGALLRINSNNSVDTNEYILINPLTSIGRDATCDITISENVVSGRHFQIEERNGLYHLIHPHPSRAQTLNGFTYQGQQYQGSDTLNHPLKHGDVFRIGEASGTMVSITFDDGSGTLQEILPQIKDVPLHNTQITLGRAPNNDITLNHETVSSHHARLEKHGSGYRIIDLQSTNHLYVNDQLETSHDLQQGDEIRIGAFKLTYEGSVLHCNENRTIRIDVKDLYKIVPGKEGEKVLLNNISLAIPARSFVALVGGSGAGKSTLMKALNGLSPGSGMVYYNGQDYYSSYAAFNTQLGYVPQDDIVHRDLTVESALYYGAKLRLPDDYTDKQIRARVREVLEEVELDQKRDLLIERLSGGQRKRVSIALELLANPSIFFLDEPTSGLDPGLDRKMMNLLRKLADKGQTIVLVTHATNNINFCDYVCFLGNGHLAYFGPPHMAKLFFGKNDFADIYNELDNEQACKQWSEKFRQHKDYQSYVAKPLLHTNTQRQQGKQKKLKTPRHKHPFAQYRLLCRRYFELLKNDRANLALLLLQAPIIALILFALVKASVGPGGFNVNHIVECPRTAQVFTSAGFPDVPSPSSPAVSTDCSQLETILRTTPQGKAYAAQRGGVLNALQDFLVPGSGNAPMILFIMVFAAIMCGCINSSREIVKESSIYQRERAIDVGILPYLFSKITILGILCLLQSFALVGIISLADPFVHGTFLPGGLEAYITIALTSLTGLTLGLTISAIVPNSDRAMSFLPLLLLPQVVFAGILFPLTNQILQIVGMIFPARWAMAALGSTVGLHADKMFGPGQPGDQLFKNNYSYHGTVFSTYSLSDATWHLIHIWLILGVMTILFVIITTACLMYKDKRSFGLNRLNCVKCKKTLAYPNEARCQNCGAEQFP
jgi:ABC-type multidrug transport system ATPase subunit/pSer/pThr/pTyr-binding forkhead associated (FHA) protein